MPALRQAAAFSGCTSAVSARIGVRRLTWLAPRMTRVASRPSTPGMRTSIRIRSNGVLMAAWTPSAPPPASSMWKPKGASISRTSSRFTAVSSTSSSRSGRQSISAPLSAS